MCRVLIVEDEFLVSLQLEDILQEGGHHVVGTLSDSAGLASVGNGDCIDVALVDLNLRDGLTGPEIARKLSAEYGAKIIYVTANPAQIDLPAPSALGVVQKPFCRDAILESIRFARDATATFPRPAGLEEIAVHQMRRSN